MGGGEMERGNGGEELHVRKQKMKGRESRKEEGEEGWRESRGKEEGWREERSGGERWNGKETEGEGEEG